MPLTPELLEQIREKLDEAKKKRADVQDVLDDLRASGIDASAQVEKLKAIDEDIKRMDVFYGRQQKRLK